jgi:dolichyl-phosphate-mannose--protein O-mannosyl transferase
VPGGDKLGFYAITVVLAFVVIPGVIYISSWFPFFIRGQFHSLGDIVNHDYQSYEFNATLKATHPFGSPWYTWPFLYKPVLYYIQYGLGTDHWGGGQLSGMITDLGNPWIWWTSLPCLVALIYFIVWRRSWPALLIALAFCAQYLPWSRVSRVLFLFEMGAMLPFMILALAFVLTRIAETEWPVLTRERLVRLRLTPIAYVHAAIAAVFFLYFYPLWTALPISIHALYEPFPWGKIWFPTWI